MVAESHASEASPAGPPWRRNRESWSLIMLLVVGTACALVWFSWPRPLVPSQLPSLRLAAAPVRAALADDARRAGDLPRSELITALDQNFLAQGRADDALGEPMSQHRARRNARLVLVQKVIDAHGEEALLCLRAHAVRRFESLLAGRWPAEEASAILGVFPNMLARHGLTRDGVEIAPTFVVRTLYKARWNTLHGLDSLHGFAPIEVQAHSGWQALHAMRVPVPTRLAALSAYERAGGEHVEEARGVLLFLNGEYGLATEALARAYADNPSLRLRNYLLGAELAADAVQ